MQYNTIKKTLSFLTTSTIFLLLSGCAAVKMQPGAEKVIVSTHKAPRQCKFLGQIMGSQGNFFTGAYTSNANLEQGSQNDLRNKAAQMGANYVALITDRAASSGSISGSDSNIFGSSQQTSVTATGNAYHCPPHLIGE